MVRQDEWSLVDELAPVNEPYLDPGPTTREGRQAGSNHFDPFSASDQRHQSR